MTHSSIVGIDFGTTKTVAALYRDGNPQALMGRSGKCDMPSRVMLTKDQKLYAGWDTEAQPGQYDSRVFTINAIKRSLGRQGEATWDWWRTSPQEIAALLLGRLKIEVEAGLQTPVDEAVIAIPAHFDTNQRWAVQQAAEIAGFTVKRLLNEATAAALWYSQSPHHRDGSILVFDFGGGTLDVSVVETGEGVVEVKGTAGDGQLGGEDVDNLLLEWAQEQVQKTSLPGFSLKNLSHAQLMYLRSQVIQAKESLSQHGQAALEIPGFLDKGGGQFADLNLSLTRSAFNSICRPLFNRIEPVIQNALDTAQVRPADLQAVLMIGGSSRIPRVEEIVTNLLGEKLYRGLDSKTSVAFGAALQAGIMDGNIREVLLLDCLPADLSVGMGNERSILFERGMAFPVKKKDTFTTSINSQQQVEVPVYEHYPGGAPQGNLLGRVTLSGIPPAAKGVPQLEVIFDIDVSGLLKVTAQDTLTRRAASAELVSPYCLNKAQISIIQKSVNAALRGASREVYNPFPKEPQARQATVLRDLEAEAEELKLQLQQLKLSAGSLFSNLPFHPDTWMQQLENRGAQTVGLKGRADTVRLELAQALPRLLALHIHNLAQGDFLQQWLASVRRKLAAETPIAEIFSAFDQGSRTWFKTLETLTFVAPETGALYAQTENLLETQQERWTLAFVLRHAWQSGTFDKAGLSTVLEATAVSKDQAVALWLRELLDDRMPERRPEALRVLGELLSPPEITGLLLQLEPVPGLRKQMNSVMQAKLHSLGLPPLAGMYLDLSESGKRLWRGNPSLRARLRKALIEQSRHASGEMAENIKKALRPLVTREGRQ